MCHQFMDISRNMEMLCMLLFCYDFFALQSLGRASYRGVAV